MATPYRRPVARQRAAPARRFTGKPAAAAPRASAAPQDWWQRQNQYNPPAAPRTAPARPMRREGPGYRPAVAAAPQAVAAAQQAMARRYNPPTAIAGGAKGWESTLPQRTIPGAEARISGTGAAGYDPKLLNYVPPQPTAAARTGQAQADAWSKTRATYPALKVPDQWAYTGQETAEAYRLGRYYGYIPDPFVVNGTLDYTTAAAAPTYDYSGGGGYYDYGGGGGGGGGYSYTPTPDRIYANRNKRTLPQGTQRAQQPQMRATSQQMKGYANVAPPARWQQLLTSWRV